MTTTAHAAMTHVVHGQDRFRIDCGHRRAQAFAHREGAADVTRAAHILREDREGILAGGLHDHVECLGGCDAELVDRHRAHVLAIGGDNGHLQTRDAHVEMGHGRAIDEAQPHLFTGLENPRPVAQRGGAVQQVGVGVAVDVRQVGRGHPHLAPRLAVPQSGRQTLFLHVIDPVADRELGEVVVVRCLFEPREQIRGVQIGPVRQQYDVVAVVGEGLWLQRIDHYRAVNAGLFLEPGMAVVPVSTVLDHVETVRIRFTAIDAVETQAGHAIHVGRQQDAVPVDRGLVAVDRVGRQFVGYPQIDRVALAPAQQWCRHRSIHGNAGTGGASEVQRCFADREVEFGACQHRLLPVRFQRPHRFGPQPETEQRAASGQPVDKLPP